MRIGSQLVFVQLLTDFTLIRENVTVHVVNLETNRRDVLVINRAFMDALYKHYPDRTFVRRMFMIERVYKNGAFIYNVAEIALVKRV